MQDIKIKCFFRAARCFLCMKAQPEELNYGENNNRFFLEATDFMGAEYVSPFSIRIEYNSTQVPNY